jgi:hypothetical protein
MESEYKEVFILLVSVLYIICYPVFILYLVLYFNLGIYSWALIAACLTPPTVFWYKTVKKRIENTLKAMIDNEPREWNVEKTAKEYVALIQKEEEKENSSP